MQNIKITYFIIMLTLGILGIWFIVSEVSFLAKTAAALPEHVTTQQCLDHGGIVAIYPNGHKICVGGKF